MGDDDRPRPDAVQAIFQAIDRYPEHLFVSFVSMFATRPKDVTSVGLAGFVETVPDFAHVVLISNDIFRCPPLLPQLHIAMHYAFSMVPHVVLVMSSLGENGKCCLSANQIVDWTPPKAAQSWSRMLAALGMPVILDLPMSMRVRRILARKIAPLSGGLWEHAVSLARFPPRGFDTEGLRYLFTQVWWRKFCLARHRGRFAALRLWSITVDVAADSPLAAELFQSYSGA